MLLSDFEEGEKSLLLTIEFPQIFRALAVYNIIGHGELIKFSAVSVVQ